MKRASSFVLGLVVLLGILASPACGPSDTSQEAEPVQRVQVNADSDAKAIEIAEQVVETLGGWEAWDRTRYLSWNFPFGNRQHYWDRWSGDVRIEGTFRQGDKPVRRLILMNVQSRRGRVFDEQGQELADLDGSREVLEQAYRAWINDSYWLVMPFKLLDPGVTLRYSGEREMLDGRMSDVLDLTFSPGTGMTPGNRYEVFVARDDGMIGQWAFYLEAADSDPKFVWPWESWTRFGEVMLSTSRGQGKDWQIAVHETLPATVFSDPAPVAL